MTHDDAISFLREHQPLPRDRNLGKALIERYDDVRKYFLEHPDTDTIPLFLNSFGNGSGFGVYQLIEDVIRKHPKSTVLPHLVAALRNSSGSVRYWSAEIASDFPDVKLVEPLIEILTEKEDDARYAAVAALSFIEDSRIVPALERARDNNADPGLEDLLVEILQNKRSSEQDGGGKRE